MGIPNEEQHLQHHLPLYFYFLVNNSQAQLPKS